MAITVEVKKGDTTRQMSEYSYMLLPYANGARGGWVYIRHIIGSSEGFDPAGNLNATRPTEQTTAMAQPFIPDEISKRLKTSGKPGSDKKVATAIDPNAGATDVDPKDTTLDPDAETGNQDKEPDTSGMATDLVPVADSKHEAGTDDPNGGATTVDTVGPTGTGIPTADVPSNLPGVGAVNTPSEKPKAPAAKPTTSPKSKTAQ